MAIMLRKSDESLGENIAGFPLPLVIDAMRVKLSICPAILLEIFVLALAELAGTYNHIQGPAKRQAPGCVNAAGKARQEW